MFTAIQKLGFKQFLLKETLPLIVALIISEMFFKFGSFTMELISFLITWYLLGKVSSSVMKVFKR